LSGEVGLSPERFKDTLFASGILESSEGQNAETAALGVVAIIDHQLAAGDLLQMVETVYTEKMINFHCALLMRR
jgi:hypothetical protein